MAWLFIYFRLKSEFSGKTIFVQLNVTVTYLRKRLGLPSYNSNYFGYK